MKTTVYKKGELISALIFISIIILLQFVYDDTIKNPFDSSSPSASGKLFYLFLYYLDKYLGKFGVFMFFGVCALFFLRRGIKCQK